MSEVDTQQGAGTPEGGQQPSADATAGDSQSQDQAGNQDTSGQSKDQGADSAGQQDADKGKDAGNAGSGDKGQSDKESGQGEDSKPRSRRSAQYRIQQLADENRRLREENERFKGAKSSADTQDDSGDQSQNDSKADQPDISKQISEEVNRRLEPVLKEHTKAADEAEISELFSGDLAAKRSEYESKIRSSWDLSQYKDLAASDLFKILDYDAAVARARTEAVEEYKKAEKEAKESSGSGASDTSNRTGKGKSVDQMTDEELQAHNERVKAGLA